MTYNHEFANRNWFILGQTTWQCKLRSAVKSCDFVYVHLLTCISRTFQSKTAIMNQPSIPIYPHASWWRGGFVLRHKRKLTRSLVGHHTCGNGNRMVNHWISRSLSFNWRHCHIVTIRLMNIHILRWLLNSFWVMIDSSTMVPTGWGPEDSQVEI